MIYQVSDVKKLNGLVSDVQMFALKTLYIPLPGRHPPSPLVTNETDAQRYDKDNILSVKYCFVVLHEYNYMHLNNLVLV